MQPIREQPAPPPPSSLKREIWNLISWLHRRRADAQGESETPTAAAAKVPVIAIKTLDIQLVSGVSLVRHDGKKASKINKNC